MSFLIAKIKDRKKVSIYYKVLTPDRNIFETDPNELQLVPYQPDHKLDEDTWFKIEQFRQEPFCLELLQNPFVSADHNDISSEQYGNMDYLCAHQGENYFFQKVTRSLYITRKTLYFGDMVKLEDSNRRLFINERPDAIYIQSTDTLVFRNLATISSIFKGIDELYREATNEEVTKFLTEPFIKLSNDYGASKVSKPNRKRIALASTTLASMSDAEREQIPIYIDSYCRETLGFNEDEQKFEVSSDEQLKLLLYGIEQRFYTTPIGSEKRVANSIQTLK